MKRNSHLHIGQTRQVIYQALILYLSKLVNKALSALFYKNQSSVPPLISVARAMASLIGI